MSKSFELICGEDEISRLVQALPKSGIIVLIGDLASGKTTLARAIVRAHGLDEHVSSPTFSIMQNYGEIYHYDIYSGGCEGIIKNGLFENLFEEGLHLIEWSQRIPAIEGLCKLSKFRLSTEFPLKFCGSVRVCAVAEFSVLAQVGSGSKILLELQAIFESGTKVRAPNGGKKAILSSLGVKISRSLSR